jgi:hypothetical protein
MLPWVGKIRIVRLDDDAISDDITNPHRFHETPFVERIALDDNGFSAVAMPHE